MLFFFPAAQAQTDALLPPIGGGGGGQFVARCPSGQLLGGVELRAGEDVDAIRPLCHTPSVHVRTVEVGEQNYLGWRVPKHSEEIVSYGVDGEATAYTGWYGGSGGGIRRLVCPGTAPFVSAIYVEAEGLRTVTVNRITLLCEGMGDSGLSRWHRNQRFWTNSPGTNTSITATFVAHQYDVSRVPSDREGTNICPGGQDNVATTLAVGIHGRSGKWLDSVGLICGAPSLLHRPPAPAPAASGSTPQTPVGRIGKVSVALPAFLYGVAPDGTLKWFRHEGANVGSFDLEGPRSVNVGWGNFKQVTHGGEGIIYAVTRQGALMRFQHAGYGEGLGRDDAAAWLPPQEIATGWGNFTQVFSGGDGVLYAVTPEGKLWWYRHTGFINGRATLEGPKDVGRGWGGLRHVFSMGDGVIYRVTSDGKLWWHRHVAYRTGAGLESPASWEGGKEVGRGWEGMRQVFSAGGGVIYAVTPDGKLWWYRHTGYRTGRGLETPGSWEARKSIGNDWGNFVQAFAQ